MRTMAKSSGTSRRKLRALVNVRLPESLATTLRARAMDAGLTDAAFVRSVLVDVLGTDLSDAHPRPRALPPYAAPPGLVGDLRVAREASGEATGAMVQLARLAREEGLTAHRDELERLIPSMRWCANAFLDLADGMTRHWRGYLRGEP